MSKLAEIAAWKDRRGRPRLGLELSFEMDRLRDQWRATGQELPGVCDFFVVRAITIIEVCVRELVREIVDAGEPYLSRSEPLLKGSRVEFEFLRSIQGQTISVGDIVAHTVSISSFSHIVAVLDRLLGDFVEGIKRVHPRWIEESADWPLKPIVDDYEKLAGDIARLFEVRHVVVHELPKSAPYQVDELEGLLTAASQFISSTDWLVVERTKGSIPRTQAAMNASAGSDLAEAQERLKLLLAEINKLGVPSPELLSTVQAAWNNFADLDAALHSSLVSGGSMEPLIFALAKKDLVDQRIAQLEWWLNREEGDL